MLQSILNNSQNKQLFIKAYIFIDLVIAMKLCVAYKYV